MKLADEISPAEMGETNETNQYLYENSIVLSLTKFSSLKMLSLIMVFLFFFSIVNRGKKERKKKYIVHHLGINIGRKDGREKKMYRTSSRNKCCLRWYLGK